MHTIRKRNLHQTHIGLSMITFVLYLRIKSMRRMSRESQLRMSDKLRSMQHGYVEM